MLPVPLAQAVLALGCGGGLGTCSPAPERFCTAPFSVEVSALGCVGEAGLGSAQTLRALTHGAGACSLWLHSRAALWPCPGTEPQLGREWQHDRDMAVPAQPCLGWAAVGSTVSVPSVHPGGVGSSGPRGDVACAEIRGQRAACRAAAEPCVEGGTPSLLPGDPWCHMAFPTQLALELGGQRGLGICWSAAAALT